MPEISRMAIDPACSHALEASSDLALELCCVAARHGVDTIFSICPPAAVRLNRRNAAALGVGFAQYPKIATIYGRDMWLCAFTGILRVGLCSSFAASFCLASFAWGMVWHFRRVAKPTPPEMALIAATALHLSRTANSGASAGTARAAEHRICAVSGQRVSILVGSRPDARKACGMRAALHFARDRYRRSYRWIRHPFYTAYNLTWIAGFVASGWWPAAVSAIVMAVLYDRSAREEERGFLLGPRRRNTAYTCARPDVIFRQSLLKPNEPHAIDQAFEACIRVQMTEKRISVEPDGERIAVLRGSSSRRTASSGSPAPSQQAASWLGGT